MVGYNQHRQRGAASIFVVTFFILLITVIAFSFMNIVIQDQEQALNNDLAQSAYDSASAGAEDAQRVLRWYGKTCISPVPAVGSPEEGDCNKLKTGDKCNLGQLSLHSTILPGVTYEPVTKEVKLEQSAADSSFEQAYSCVGVQTQTEDYVTNLIDMKSNTLIPLKTVANQPFDNIEVNWHMVGGNSPDVAKGDVNLPNTSVAADAILPKTNGDSSASIAQKWGTGRPPILRIEIIPTKRGEISIDDMNKGTKTLFLYPSQQGATVLDVKNSDIDRGRTKDSAPQIARCNESADDGQYVCSVRLENLYFAEDEPNGSNTDFFVRVSSIYANTQFRMRLFDSTSVVRFDNVSPKIDSTGRANDVYRRVESRLIVPSSPNPTTDGGFDITQGLCKDFQVPEYDSDCPTAAPRLDQDE